MNSGGADPGQDRKPSLSVECRHQIHLISGHPRWFSSPSISAHNWYRVLSMTKNQMESGLVGGQEDEVDADEYPVFFFLLELLF